MNLERLLQQNKLKPHSTSREEIQNLLYLIERDIRDAKVPNLSSDRQFATAYNAILQSCTIILYCHGYKTQGIGHHFTVFQAVKKILGERFYDIIDYFDACRSKRNLVDYSYAGNISQTEAKELISSAEDFLKTTKKWLKTNFSNYI